MSEPELEAPLCPLCGNGRYSVVFGKFTPYKVVQCQDCNFYFLSPRPTEEAMIQLYSTDKYFAGQAVGYSDYEAQEASLRATFRALLDELATRKLVGGSLLEIGCGYGYLLDEAKCFCQKRVGTDFSAEAVAHAQHKADRIYKGGIKQIPKNELFDCVIATHVIEHVHKPIPFVQQLSSHLKPGGKLVLAAPDMGSFWRRLLGHRWPSFKLPEHLLYFDRKSFYRLLSDAGYQNITFLPYPHAFPLPLIASKLNLPLPDFLKNYFLWLPATTIAICGIHAND